ncbi:hypothetical protein FQA39_LY05734 [Lamprigera yunnana]|nr:hypothetical protein FQA39_LY05734 [Lamprigera yunnana]
MFDCNKIILEILLTLFLYYLWVNIRLVQKKRDNSICDVILFIILLPFLFSVIGVLIVLVAFLWLYRTVITVILKLSLGYEFFGVIKGMDVIMGCEDPKNSLIASIVIFKCDKTIAAFDLFKYFSKIVENVWSKSPQMGKFFTTINTYKGYLYLKKIKINVEDLVCTLPTVEGQLDKEQLLKLVGNYYYKPLPINNTGLWDIHIGTQPIKWREDEKNEKVQYYPIFLRGHPVVGDRVTFVKLFTRALADFNEKHLEKLDVFHITQPKQSWIKKILQTVRLLFKIFVYFLSEVYVYCVIKRNDNSILCGRNTGNRELVQFLIDKDGSYFEKVKLIKQKCFSTSFPEIIMTAFSASLFDYYKKYNQVCPDYITAALPVIDSYQRVIGVTSGQIVLKDVVLNNRFMYLQIKLPINIAQNKQFDENFPLLSRLNSIKEVTKLVKDSVESQVCDILITGIKSLLPLWFHKLHHSLRPSTILRLIPGPPTFSYVDGVFVVSDLMFMIPHILNLPLNLSSLTYENMLILGLHCNTCIISQQSHLDEILGNIYRYIDILEKEVKYASSFYNICF